MAHVEMILHQKKATPQTDIWSLGCSIAEVFKEKVLWDISNVIEISLMFAKKTKIDLPAKYFPDVSTINILKKCLDYEPGIRPENMWNYFREQKKH